MESNIIAIESLSSAGYSTHQRLLPLSMFASSRSVYFNHRANNFANNVSYTAVLVTSSIFGIEKARVTAFPNPGDLGNATSPLRVAEARRSVKWDISRGHRFLCSSGARSNATRAVIAFSKEFKLLQRSLGIADGFALRWILYALLI